MHQQGLKGATRIAVIRTIEANGRQYKVDVGVPLNFESPAPTNYRVNQTADAVVLEEREYVQARRHKGSHRATA